VLISRVRALVFHPDIWLIALNVKFSLKTNFRNLNGRKGTLNALVS
jgi:hypothetical protein